MNGLVGAVFGLAGGAGFILLGRWIYTNPKKAFYIRSIYADPDSRFLKVGAKIFGTFFISFGACAAGIAALGSLMNANSTVWLIIPLGSGVLGGWFLRPRIAETPHTVVEQPAAKPGGFLTRRGKFLIVWALGSGGFLTAAVLIVIWTGESHLIPAVIIVFALVTVVAMAAILWW